MAAANLPPSRRKNRLAVNHAGINPPVNLRPGLKRRGLHLGRGQFTAFESRHEIAQNLGRLGKAPFKDPTPTSRDSLW